MRKAVVLLIPVAAVLIGSAVVATDLDEIIARHAEARGGLEKIKSMNSMKTFGKTHMGELEFPFITYHLRPNKMKIESSIQGQKMIQCFNGETGWYINPMSGSWDPQEMDERGIKELKTHADLDGFLIDPKEKGYKVELIGEDEVEGSPVYRLLVTDTADLHIDVYVDAEYFLEIKWT
ncbi:MAG: hypothetical protein AB1744_14890, partial [Candidatus Zixiibacteriota bacterium]